MRASKPRRTALAIVAVTLIVAATVALATAASVGAWVVAVVGGSLLGTFATLAVLALTLAARGELTQPVRGYRDEVTRLPGLEMLESDLRRVLSGRAPEPHLLCVFALDGLKRYDDAYGEASGDVLLAWLAHNLLEAVGDRATVYRTRGGNFALLAPGPEELTSEVRADASAALFEIGDGFAIWSSISAVSLPQQGITVAEALELADRRAHSSLSLPALGLELGPPDTPSQALSMFATRDDVGALARRVGRRLGVPAAELDDLEAATQLRDVGNVAIPSTVLMHPGGLPGHEWEFIRLHTIVGARLIAARFGMDGVGRLVRSSHERWDGGGYPDGRRGEDIPLGARIVFVCSAFADMTADRPHHPALTGHEAIAELEAGAGSQFDPGVVHAVSQALLTDRGPDATAMLSAPAQLRVLLADADPVSRFLLQRTIESAGHTCVAVSNGVDAWESCREEPADIVIGDMLIPQSGGVELGRRIRSSLHRPCYFILLTSPESRDRLGPDARAVADDVLAKPVERFELALALGRAVGQRWHGPASNAA